MASIIKRGTSYRTVDSAETISDMTVAEAVKQAQQHIAEAFALIASIVEASAKTESLEALTVDEVAGLLRKSRSTIYQMCKDGRLTRIDERIPRRVLNEYLDGKRPKHTKHG